MRVRMSEQNGYLIKLRNQDAGVRHVAVGLEALLTITDWATNIARLQIPLKNQSHIYLSTPLLKLLLFRVDWRSSWVLSTYRLDKDQEENRSITCLLRRVSTSRTRYLALMAGRAAFEIFRSTLWVSP